jgi:hypothetical protein
MNVISWHLELLIQMDYKDRKLTQFKIIFFLNWYKTNLHFRHNVPFTMLRLVMITERFNKGELE